MKSLLKWGVPILALGVTGVSAAMILYFILRYGVDIPYNDQWEYVGFFDHYSLCILSFEELFRFHNEYRKFFPNLITVLMGAQTHWNVRYEMWLIFGAVVLTSFNIYRLASLTNRGAAWQKWLAFALSSLFIFSPMQWENWIFGVQLEYYLPILCITACFTISFLRIHPALKLVWCAVLCTISTFSSVNGMISWLIVFPALAFTGNRNEVFRKWFSIALWILVTIGALILYFTGFSKTGTHPSMQTVLEEPWQALLYFFGTIGNSFRVIHSLDMILWMGAAVFTVFLLQIIYIFVHRKDQALVKTSMIWILLGFYSLGTSVLLTLGRMGFGLDQSLASRYTGFTLFIDVAVIFLGAILLQHRHTKKPLSVLSKLAIAGAVLFIVGSKVFTYPTAYQELRAYHANIRHGKAGLLFIDFVAHVECESKVYPGDYVELQRKAHILDSMGYLRPRLVKTKFINELEGEKSGVWDFGTLDQLVPLNDTIFTAFGSALMPENKETADAILFTYRDTLGRDVLFAFYNGDSMSFHKTFFYFSHYPRPTEISAWAFDGEKREAYRLKQKHRIE